MQSQFEIFIKCPKTNEFVSTGYTTQNSTFSADEKPYGVFNCPSCGQSHSWSHEEAQIHEVHR